MKKIFAILLLVGIFSMVRDDVGAEVRCTMERFDDKICLSNPSSQIKSLNEIPDFRDCTEAGNRSYWYTSCESFSPPQEECTAPCAFNSTFPGNEIHETVACGSSTNAGVCGGGGWSLPCTNTQKLHLSCSDTGSADVTCAYDDSCVDDSPPNFPTATSIPFPTSPPPTSTPMPTLTPPAGCNLKTTGDANCIDGITDTDFLFWQCEFLSNTFCNDISLTSHIMAGLSYSGKFASFNLDQKVDLIDFEIWRRSSFNIAPTPTTPAVGDLPPPSPSPTTDPNKPKPTPGSNKCQCNGGGALAQSNCYANYRPICIGDSAGDSSCTCRIVTPTPTSTPNSNSNKCQCDLGVLMQNNCNINYKPRCVGQSGCACDPYTPGAGATITNVPN